MSYATLDRRDLCDLARFRILDARNCNEAAKDRLLLAMADEIDRLRDLGQGIVSVGPYDHEYGNCLYCSGCDEGTGARRRGKPAHDADCPWLGLKTLLGEKPPKTR